MSKKSPKLLTEKELKRRMAFFLVDKLELAIFDLEYQLKNSRHDEVERKDIENIVAEYKILLEMAKADYEKKGGKKG